MRWLQKSGVERSALVRDAVRQIAQETLEGEVSERQGRGYCNRPEASGRGQRNGWRDDNLSADHQAGAAFAAALPYFGFFST